MIKLLLVEDEILSREGIIEKLPWKDMGVDFIEQADDGLTALEKAAGFQPDVILTDVRMPRMDGIELAFKVRETYPNCKIIFMSGYSDKAYLKSAIELSAVSYVEKPIDLEELQTAIEKSVSLVLEERDRKMREMEINQKLVTSIPAVKNDMALKLIRSHTWHESILDGLKIVNPSIKPDSDFMTMILKSDDIEELEEKPPYDQQEICDFAELFLGRQGFHVLGGIKDDCHIVIHIGLDSTGGHSDTETLYMDLAAAINQKWKVFISVGVPINGIQNVYQSYNTAVIELQKRFYHRKKTIIFYEENHHENYELEEKDMVAFVQFLTEENKPQCEAALHQLADCFRKNHNTPVHYVKECYKRLLEQLTAIAKSKGISQFEKEAEADPMKDRIAAFCYLDDIEGFMTERIDLFFKLISERGQTSVITADILKFIQDHYQDRNLGLDLISEQFLVTPSYICVIFKEEIGKTVNQYITELRIEEAKKLLANTRIKVKMIAENVGYSNDNYFIKAFRKVTGLTPKEYREKGL